MSWRWGTPSALVPFYPSEYADFVWQLEKIQDYEKEYESVPEMTESLKSYMKDSRQIIQRIKDNENVAREELNTQITKGNTLLETAKIYGRIDNQIRALAIYEQIQGLPKVSEIASLSDCARNVEALIIELTKLYNKTWGKDSHKALIREIKPYGDPNARMEGDSDSQ